MPAPTIAIASCRSAAGAAPDDLVEDVDAPLLRQALGELGWRSRSVAWDDPRADWSAFDRVALRSSWDSDLRPDEFLNWCDRVATCSTLVNPVEIVRWNLDKRYLADLASAGVATVPTAWVTPGDRWDPPPVEYVVKPAISAGGRETARYAPGEAGAARAHVERLHAEGRTVMVQDYLHAVDGEGELDLVFIAGSYSHATRKAAMLLPGEGVVDRLWERMVITPVEPDDAAIRIGATAVEAVRSRTGLLPAYARVDLIDGLVGELELIDPSLSLVLAPQAAGPLAAALVASAAH